MKFCGLSGVQIQGMFRSECPEIFIMGIRKGHNTEDVRLKTRPAGRCPISCSCVIVSYQAISMLSKQSLDSAYWAAPEFMIINHRCLTIC